MSSSAIHIGLVRPLQHRSGRPWSQYVAVCFSDSMLRLNRIWCNAGSNAESYSSQRRILTPPDRVFTADVFGMGPCESAHIFSNRQIVDTSNQRMKQVQHYYPACEASCEQPDNAGSSNPSRDRNPAVDSLRCKPADVAAQLQKVQQDRQFCLQTALHKKPSVNRKGVQSMLWYCDRHEQPSKTFIIQYINVGSNAQRQQSTSKAAGCRCWLSVKLPAGSHTAVNLLNGKPFEAAGEPPHHATAVGQACFAVE